jgi:hypothetical protein
VCVVLIIEYYIQVHVHTHTQTHLTLHHTDFVGLARSQLVLLVFQFVSRADLLCVGVCVYVYTSKCQVGTIIRERKAPLHINTHTYTLAAPCSCVPWLS